MAKHLLREEERGVVDVDLTPFTAATKVRGVTCVNALAIMTTLSDSKSLFLHQYRYIGKYGKL